MAEIKSIDVKGSNIEVKVNLNKEEYRLLRNNTADLVVFPSGNESLVYSLTTGKLGNSNRIMIPKKLLETFKIREMDKKVPANIFTIEGDYYILMKIKKSEVGIPKFSEGEKI